MLLAARKSLDVYRFQDKTQAIKKALNECLFLSVISD